MKDRQGLLLCSCVVANESSSDLRVAPCAQNVVHDLESEAEPLAEVLIALDGGLAGPSDQGPRAGGTEYQGSSDVPGRQ